jgi:hypothetical protein
MSIRSIFAVLSCKTTNYLRFGQKVTHKNYKKQGKMACSLTFSKKMFGTRGEKSYFCSKVNLNY